jgi:ATP-dependent DNA ligase
MTPYKGRVATYIGACMACAVFLFIQPCRPTVVPTPPSGRGWAHELKHDGYRLQIHVGQFNKSVQIIAFNTTENWSRDVTANIVIKLLEESQQGRFVSEAARKLIERITGEQFTVTA